jgi:hypothetical protein
MKRHAQLSSKSGRRDGYHCCRQRDAPAPIVARLRVGASTAMAGQYTTRHRLVGAEHRVRQGVYVVAAMLEKVHGHQRRG